MQLRQIELEAEFESEFDKEASVRVQVSPTSWLRIPARAARQHADLTAMVRDAREVSQQRATNTVERHRANVIQHANNRRGAQSLTYLLRNAESTWREPTSSLAQEALRTLLHSQYAIVLIELLEAVLRDPSAEIPVAQGAIRLLVLVAVPSSSGVHSADITAKAHAALSNSSLATMRSAELIAESLTRLHLDTGHAHYVLLLQELTEETAYDPETANFFLSALEQTHQTYSDECHDRSADNYLDYHDLQVSLCSASLAYITGAVDTPPPMP